MKSSEPLPSKKPTKRPSESGDERVTAPTLVSAAQSLVAARGEDEGLSDVLRAHALGHYGESVRQYLCVQLRDPGHAKALLAALSARVADLPDDELTQAPGTRARIFRLARQLLDEHLAERSKPAGTGTLAWFRPRKPISTRYSLALDAARDGALSADAELLELHFARDLSVDEIAFVLDEPVAGIEARLEAATREARAHFQEGGDGSVDLPQALLEAFALERAGTVAAPSDDDLQLSPGVVIGGRYRIDQQIGAGGFSQVYRATDTEVEGHQVALKVLYRRATSEQARRNALRELQIIASVFHPSIVQFKDHGWHEERFWFVMPWYKGETLEDRLARGPISRAEARRVFVPLARALATMHAAGLRHQDVKPENIFLADIEGFGASGEEVLPVLLDLGVAAKEAELMLAGTPTYFAPEVAAGFAGLASDHVVSAKSDVFSLALSLRDALDPDGRELITAGSVDRFIAHRAASVPDAPRGELSFLAPHFARWLSADPDARPTADELAEQLAVLTLPEEQRERRMRALRVVVPLVLTLIAVFSVVAWQLELRARLGQAEAAEAKLRAASIEDSLEDETERRQALEEEVAAAQERYRSSQLTREQLVTRLAESETKLAESGRSVAALRRAGQRVTQERDEARERITVLEREVTGARSRAAAAETRVAQLTTELASARDAAQASQRLLEQERAELARVREQLTGATQRASAAEQAAAAAEQRAAAAAQAAASAEQRAEQAERELRAARAEVEQAERRVRALEAEVAALRARPAPTPAPTPTPGPPGGGVTTSPAPGVRPAIRVDP